MGARPIASFAAAAAARRDGRRRKWSAGGGITPAPVESGVPRAIIPPMEEIGLGPRWVGLRFRRGLRSHRRTDAPVEQRIPSLRKYIGAGIAPAQVSNAGNWAANLAPPSADAPASLPRPEQIADLKPLGQVSASFIVAVNGDGLWLVDQHVRTSACSFEQHLEARRAENRSAAHAHASGDWIIAAANRDIEKMPRSWRQRLRSRTHGSKERGHPGCARGSDRSRRRETASRDSRRHRAENARFDRNVASENRCVTACHAAIKVNMPLEQSKMEWLLDALAKTDCPMSCPHGGRLCCAYS